MGLFEIDAAKAAWANAWARCQNPGRLAGIAYQASINNHADAQDLATQAAAAYLASGS